MFYFEWNGLNLLFFFVLDHLRALLKPPPLAVGRAAIVPAFLFLAQEIIPKYGHALFLFSHSINL